MLYDTKSREGNLERTLMRVPCGKWERVEISPHMLPALMVGQQ